MAPFKKILIATDGSENARAAASKGLALAKLTGAEVTVLSVIDVGMMAYAARGPSMVDVYDLLEETARDAVDGIRKEAEAMGLAVRSKVKKGVPANEIIEESKDYDLVVMGCLGRGGLQYLLMGSVAEKVVRFAHCPVLVVRQKRTP